ncbi:MAG: hypothetical protein IPJ88_06530 [Myxococcales bacterium]|nr:MAG: hypothetical protein IPJ88_06530 [Myxococcales bacterium]
MRAFKTIGLSLCLLFASSTLAYAQVGPDQDPGSMLSDYLLAAEGKLACIPVTSETLT